MGPFLCRKNILCNITVLIALTSSSIFDIRYLYSKFMVKHNHWYRISLKNNSCVKKTHSLSSMLVSTTLIKFSSVLILPEFGPLESSISSILREIKKQYEILLSNVENFYVLKIGLNLFEISKQALKFENFIQIWK